MKSNQKKAVLVTIVVFCLVLTGFLSVSAEEYDAMKGVESVKVFFDMRDGIPGMADAHMKLIHHTYKELKSMKKDPDFVVVFMGSSVKLISSNRRGFSSQDQMHMKNISETIKMMAEEGVRFEVCIAAVEYFNVDPASIQSEIKHVGNGWISEIGYQARGYALVPVY